MVPSLANRSKRSVGGSFMCLAAKQAMSADGSFPAKGPETAFKALASVDDKLAAAKLNLNAVYTNDFVKKANLKYPKG